MGKLSKNEMPGSVGQWTLVVHVKKTSLHFNSWKTTDRLVQADYMMWPVRAHSDICLLIKSNCAELQPSINILISVVWLLNHSVQLHRSNEYLCEYNIHIKKTYANIITQIHISDLCMNAILLCKPLVYEWIWMLFIWFAMERSHTSWKSQ
jgi:hypothetical protein